MSDHYDRYNGMEELLGTNLAEVGTDCISRQDALEAFGLSEKTRKYGGDHSGYDTMMMYEIQDTIENLPPIQPKKGRWERHYSRPNVYADLFWHCSECGYKDSENYAPVYHHFCPNCGAKMEGGQDG